MPKIKSRVNTSSFQNSHLIFDTERKETTRCPSGPGALVLSACTGRRLKAWMLIAFTNKGGFRVGAGGDSSGGGTKMASKPPDEQHDIVSLPSQREYDRHLHLEGSDSKSGKAACRQAGLASHPWALRILS